MSLEITKILDTSFTESGLTSQITERFLRLSLPLRFHIDLPVGDVVQIQGRLSNVDLWDTLHEFTDETPADIYMSRFMRAVRVTDTGAGECIVKVMNPYNELILTEIAIIPFWQLQTDGFWLTQDGQRWDINA